MPLLPETQHVAMEPYIAAVIAQLRNGDKEAQNVRRYPPLVSLLVAATEDVRVAAALALCDIAYGIPANQRAIAAAGGIPPLVRLLGKTNAAIQWQAAETLVVLARHRISRAAIAAAGGILPLVRLLSAPSGPTRVAAAAVLAGLSHDSPGTHKAIAAAGAIPPLVRMVHYTSGEGQRAATAVLGVLASEYPPCRPVIAAAGGIPALQQVAHHSRNAGENDMAMIALEHLAPHLARSPANQQAAAAAAAGEEHPAAAAEEQQAAQEATGTATTAAVPMAWAPAAATIARTAPAAADDATGNSSGSMRAAQQQAEQPAPLAASANAPESCTLLAAEAPELPASPGLPTQASGADVLQPPVPLTAGALEALKLPALPAGAGAPVPPLSPAAGARAPETPASLAAGADALEPPATPATGTDAADATAQEEHSDSKAAELAQLLLAKGISHTESLQPPAAEQPTDSEADAELAQLPLAMGVSETAGDTWGGGTWGAGSAAATAGLPAGGAELAPAPAASPFQQQIPANPAQQQQACRTAALEALSYELQCPINHERMRDPVLAADGRTYERTAIETWIARRRAEGRAPISPVIGESLAHLQLTPVHALRGIIAAAAGLLCAP
eukprot:scaffold29.g5950.t1